jgi:probable phosphoglycerate mutase
MAPDSHDHDSLAEAQPGRPRAWLVRHGETEWSRAGRHTSHTDIPLTARGRDEAMLVRDRIGRRDFELILSSPRIRALDTARLASFGERVEVDDDLAEWDYGIFEGKTTAEIRQTEPGWSVWIGAVTGGESADDVARRVDRVIARVRSQSGDSLLFAHKHVLRVLAARWLDLPPVEGRHLALDTATISVLGWERETPVIERWNEPCGGG